MQCIVFKSCGVAIQENIALVVYSTGYSVVGL